MNNTELAKALFEALAVGDVDTVRSLCTPDCQARQNNGPAMDLEALLSLAQSALRGIKDFRYEDIVRSETESGFVEEHSARGTLPDGSELDLAVCVVADVRDGAISDIREYVANRNTA